MSKSLSHQLKYIQIPNGLDKAAEFIKFCEWSAQPREVRTPVDQKQLAKELGVDVSSLSLWKRNPEFEYNRRMLIREWLGDEIPDVMHIVKVNALKGDTRHIDILLRWLDELSSGSNVNVQVNVAPIYGGVSSVSTNDSNSEDLPAQETN